MTNREIGAKLKELREGCGKTREEVADLLGKSVKTIGHWETGYAQPDANTLFLLCTIYDADLNSSFGFGETKSAPAVSAEAMTVAKQYDAAPAMIKTAVRAVLDSVKSNIVEMPKQRKSVPYLYGMAAGAAEAPSDLFFDDYETDDERAEFAIHVNGNSMEPYLHDGEVALGVKRWPRDGEVGAFYLDGGFLVKQVVVDSEGNVHLFSLNRARADADDTIWHDSGRDLRCIGTILVDGKLPPLPD